MPETFGGKVLGTDLARNLLEKYATGRAGRIRYVNATGRIAQAYAKDRLWREISNPQGRDLLMFTAGGVAASKSSAVTPETVAQADLVFDGTLRETQWAIDTIRQARENGWDVEIEYIQRPMPLVIRGAIKRAQEEGRWGAIADLPAIHQQAQASILQIAEAFKDDPGVQIHYWLNAGTEKRPAPTVPLSREEIDIGGEFSYADLDEGSQRNPAREAAQGGERGFSARWQREVEDAFLDALESGNYDPQILAGLAEGSSRLEALSARRHIIPPPPGEMP